LTGYPVAQSGPASSSSAGSSPSWPAEPSSARAPGSASGASERPDRLRVLAVSADEDVAALMRAVFEETGDLVDSLVDLAEGVARAQELPPDLAFVDVSMGQRAGLALVHHVKAVAADADVYALARTDALEAASQAVSLGATGLSVYPPSGDELLNAANAVRVRRAAARLKAQLKREVDGARRALGYVARLASLADKDERDEVAVAIGEVFREATGMRVAALYLPTADGSTELRCVTVLGQLPEAITFTDEMGLMRYARDAGLETVPLLAGRLSIGHLLLGDGGADYEGLRPIVHVLAAQATTTLALVGERERVSRGTIKDAATSAYTFAYFVDIAGREIDKAHRHNRRFALATIATGEPVSAEGKLASRAVDVAEIVLGTVRDSDVLARVDDREFYLLLPETGGLGAHACRRRVLGLQSASEAGHKGAPLLSGVTMGVATYPHDGNDLLRLLRMAKRRADASRASVVNLLKLTRLSLPEITDVLLWDVNIAQGKLEPLPETPRALELPVVDVLGLISGMLAQAVRGGSTVIVVSQREGLGFAAGVRGFPGSSREATEVHTLDVRHRDGCEDLEALSVVAEHGAYALLGRVEHGMFHGVHAADPLLADLVAQRLAELAGVRIGELWPGRSC
jgi:DNA-binding response OmpR family regulator